MCEVISVGGDEWYDNAREVIAVVSYKSVLVQPLIQYQLTPLTRAIVSPDATSVMTTSSPIVVISHCPS
jgi:hypothetical protein